MLIVTTYVAFLNFEFSGNEGFLYISNAKLTNYMEVYVSACCTLSFQSYSVSMKDTEMTAVICIRFICSHN